MTDQDEYASHARALLQVVSHADTSDPSSGAPDGVAQLSYVNFDGFSRTVEIVKWRRIDQGLLREGDEFAVHIQARQHRDLRLPLSTATVRCRLTLNPEDTDRITVGDPHVHGWHFGVLVKGAVVLREPERERAFSPTPRG